MKRYFLPVTLLLTAATIFFSCEKKHENNASNYDSTAQYDSAAHSHTNTAIPEVTDASNEIMAERTTFNTDAEAKIKQNEEKIAELRKMKKANKTDNDAYNAKIDELEAKNKEFKKRMDEYNDETTNTDSNNKEKWESFKREFNHDMDELYNSLNDIGKNNVK